MKKQIAIILLLAAPAFSGHAQYRQMLADGSEWYVYHWFESACNETYRITGDSTFNGVAYKKMIIDPFCAWNSEEITLLREDTAARQVFQLWPVDSSEWLIYDFSLLPGDSFDYYGTQLALDSITNNVVVPIGGFEDRLVLELESPRVFYFSGGGPYPVVWVEGIGSLAGLLASLHSWGGGDLGETLLCHYNPQGERQFHYIYREEPSPCTGPVLEVKEPLSAGGAVSAYPNPASGTVWFETEDGHTRFREIRIFDAYGRLLKVDPFNGGNSAGLSGLPAGLLIGVLQTEEGQRRVVKFIKH